MTDEPADNTEIQYDGIWRPEEWRGKYLVIRHVQIQEDPVICRRDLDSPNNFSAFSNIYETLEAAEQRCSVLNNQPKETDSEDLPDQTD